MGPIEYRGLSPAVPPWWRFGLESLAAGHAREPLFHDSRKVVGMDCAGWLSDLLLQREACIIQRTLIDEIDSTVRPKGPGHRGIVSMIRRRLSSLCRRTSVANLRSAIWAM